MKQSMDYMNKFIEDLPKKPNIEEYRLYLFLRAGELIRDSFNEEQRRKNNMIEKSIEYTGRAKKGDNDILTEINNRFGFCEEVSNGALF